MTQPGAIEVLKPDEVTPSVPSPLGLRAVSAAGGPEGTARPRVQRLSASRSVWATEALHRRLLALSDITAMTAALVAVVGRFGIGLRLEVGLTFVPAFVLFFYVAGLYNRDHLRLTHSTLDELPLLLQLTGLFALGIAMLQSVLLARTLAGAQIAGLWLTSFAAIAGGRVMLRVLTRRFWPVERCLVIGEVTDIERISERIEASRARATVVGAQPFSRDDVRTARATRVLDHVVNELRVHRVIICPFATDSEGMAELVRVAKGVGVRVSMLPGMFQFVGAAVEFDDLEGMTMLGVPRFGLSPSSRLLKRTFDLVVTVVALTLLGPIIAAIALAIRLESRGPIFFRQVRIGRDGEPFLMTKFRSMVVDAESLKEQLRALNAAGPGLFKLTDDPRVTRVGRVVRSTSLDELPQLFNVLRGQMSLVGPRPLVTDEDARVFGLDRSRLHLKPGMTGPWQTLSSRVPLQEMVAIDYRYVSSWSLWLDLKIMLRTALYVLRRGNV